MSERFFEDPILNSPYECPTRHWELVEGMPTGQELPGRRGSRELSPIPPARKRGRQDPSTRQPSLIDPELAQLSTDEQYEVFQLINSVRSLVGQWRNSPERQWGVTPETARLLQHWRHADGREIRPFFCQIEAVETLIWLTEVAPQLEKQGKAILKVLNRASEEHNKGLLRIALKLATGAGKTTVMAMLIAWQTINAARRPEDERFTKGFLVVTPGLTIRERLQVLLPNHEANSYDAMALVPHNLRPEINKAIVVITNYHAFKRQEILGLSKGTRQFMEGWRRQEIETVETEGRMLQRLLPQLLAMPQVLVLNDEAHHCYRENQRIKAEDRLSGLSSEDKAEAKTNREAARLWISGLETLRRKMIKGRQSFQQRVIDLSATPFFLASSGYAEGTLFPWTVSDFSLMDAIECGIVKLPRVPVADNVSQDVPRYRELWQNIRSKMPKTGRSKAGAGDPQALPTELKSAIAALYGHYEKTNQLWEERKTAVPPCFIIVCNNTSTSKLVYDYVSGYLKTNELGDEVPQPGACKLFSNYDENLNPHAMPRTLLIDSQQLESGEGLDPAFREVAGPEIEQLRKDIRQREGAGSKNADLSDAELLRAALNSVGKPGKLGTNIRCVVSVAMLTEGWDANNVTHILGVRAFSTQLLCEQVMGRALRRLSYELNLTKDPAVFDVEYADILGIPFDFTSKSQPMPPKPPPEMVEVLAVKPDRDSQAIIFPHVIGYRVELPDEKLSATFGDDHVLELTPELVGATRTNNQGILGEGVVLNLDHEKDMRLSSLIYRLAARLVETQSRDGNGEPRRHLIMQYRSVVRQWLEQCLVCRGGTNRAQLLYQEILDMACERIHSAIVISASGERKRLALLDSYNPTGTTAHVNFKTSKPMRWITDPRHCHINLAICDSAWELEFCRVIDHHPKVRRWVKNQGLGFEVPYQMGGVARRYIPDFIVLVDDGRGDDDLLHLVCEVKGYRGEDAKVKKNTMEAFWVPGVNNSGRFGRWGFAEFREVFAMETDFASAVDDEVNQVLNQVLTVEVV
jgi:type III restriction enzyme